jgi:hypothetical protein
LRFTTESLKGKFYACKIAKSSRMISCVVTANSKCISERLQCHLSLSAHVMFSMLISFFYPEDGSSRLL